MNRSHHSKHAMWAVAVVALVATLALAACSKDVTVGAGPGASPTSGGTSAASAPATSTTAAKRATTTTSSPCNDTQPIPVPVPQSGGVGGGVSGDPGGADSSPACAAPGPPSVAPGAPGGSGGSGGPVVSSPPMTTIPGDPAVPPMHAKPVTPKPGTANPQPSAFTKATADATGKVVTVEWWGGVEPCSILDRVEVQETATTVTITLFVGSDPSGREVACIMIAQLLSTTVTLSSPLGTRTIVDGAA